MAEKGTFLFSVDKQGEHIMLYFPFSEMTPVYATESIKKLEFQVLLTSIKNNRIF